MKNTIKIILISILTIVLSVAIVSGFTWPNWLIAQNWDIITISKWNDLLNLINTKKPRTVSTNRDDANINTTRYYWSSYSDWSWEIDKETGSWTWTVVSTATNLTNTWVTYSSWWVNRASLTY